MTTEKVEYGLLALSEISNCVRAMSCLLFIIAVLVSFFEIKGLSFSVSFVALAGVSFMLSEEGLNMSTKKFIKAKLSFDRIKAKRGIDNNILAITNIVCTPPLFLFFDKNISHNQMYMMVFVTTYVAIIFYAILLMRTLDFIFETVFGDKV